MLIKRFRTFLVALVLCGSVPKTSHVFGYELPEAASSKDRHQTNQRDKASQTCLDVRNLLPGIYRLQPKTGSGAPFRALCDNNYSNGGWTVIQNRFNGSVDFYRGWKNYAEGFGNLQGEFWLGLEKIHQLTSSKRHELAVLLEDFEGTTVVAKYDNFRVADEAEQYKLESLGQYSGTAGDELAQQLGQKFTTFDADNDSLDPGNCAVYESGAWWYKDCTLSNLNGKYLGQDAQECNKVMYWTGFHNSCYSLKSSRMMIRVKV
ncbi:angiopoietin-related protein 1-like [Uranotaenia lowii]|uniref:angiopoietin-related protein 1-like n=1 Tax=Uranotaenia lowii TaxID=190385 RepID=UPI0024786C64|nr:angiopoietin-related protein 1-like [Uranotaenia lowii]